MENSQLARPPYRQMVKENGLCVGCIIWLPPKDLFNGGIKCISPLCLGLDCEELNEEGYNHPVLVIGMWKRYTYGKAVSEYAVLCLAPYNLTNLSIIPQRRTRQHRLQKSIPVYYPGSEPVSQMTENGIKPLFLENDTFTKQLYVETSHIYGVDEGYLRSFRAYGSPTYKYRLCEKSYQDLMDLLGFMPHEYVETETIAQKSKRSHHMNGKPRERQPPSGNRSAYVSTFLQYSGYESSYNEFGDSADFENAYYGSTVSAGYISNHEVPYSGQTVRALNKGMWVCYPVDMWIYTLCQRIGRIIWFLLSTTWYILKWCIAAFNYLMIFFWLY